MTMAPTPMAALEWAARAHTHSPAVADDAHSLTYGLLFQSVVETADALLASGVSRGDRIVHLGANACAHAVMLFATAALGAVYAPLSPWVMGTALQDAIRQVDPKAVLLGRSLIGRPLAEEFEPGKLALGADCRIVDLLNEEWRGRLAPQALRIDPQSVPAREPNGAELPWLMMFTSGMTSQPKAIVYSQSAFTMQAMIMNGGLQMGPSDRFLVVFHASHYGGLIPVVQTVAAGASLRWVSVPYPKQILKLISEERMTVVVAVPSLWRDILTLPEAGRASFASLRMANVGSDRIPKTLLRQVMDVTGAVSIQGYGMSETGLVTLQPPGEAQTHLGSAGFPLPFAALEIRADGGSLAPTGEEGVIWVRNPFMSSGVWREGRVAPHELDANGFFQTGDHGSLDAQGRLRVQGREGGFLKVNGLRIAPTEIEEALLAHPAIADVAVIGIADDRQGQAPVAVVVLAPAAKPTARELKAWVADRVAPQAVPKQILRARRLPRTPDTRKTQRNELARQVAEGRFPDLDSSATPEASS